MAYVLRELGDWEQSEQLCRELGAGHARPDDALVADGVLGAILGFRGDARAAIPLLVALLRDRGAAGRRLDGRRQRRPRSAGSPPTPATGATAQEHFRAVLERWERSEDHHYAVWGLRAAAQVFATGGDLARARACSEALSAIAATTGHPDALSALAHALGETALAEGDAAAAAHQIGRALELQTGPRDPVRAGADRAAGRRRAGRRGRARAGARTARGGLPLRAQARGQARSPPRPPPSSRASASRSNRTSAAAPPPSTRPRASRAASSR